MMYIERYYEGDDSDKSTCCYIVWFMYPVAEGKPMSAVWWWCVKREDPYGAIIASMPGIMFAERTGELSELDDFPPRTPQR
jgi:hypothetical protein